MTLAITGLLLNQVAVFDFEIGSRVPHLLHIQELAVMKSSLSALSFR